MLPNNEVLNFGFSKFNYIQLQGNSSKAGILGGVDYTIITTTKLMDMV
jgi:hypothetical protein